MGQIFSLENGGAFLIIGQGFVQKTLALSKAVMHGDANKHGLELHTFAYICNHLHNIV